MQPDPEKQWRGAVSVDGPTHTDRLRPLHWTELANLPRLDPLIKRLLDLGGKSILYGESNSGKSFLALDIAAHVALGWDWRGHRTRQYSTLIVSAEGQLGIENRITAFRYHHEIDQDFPLFTIASDIDLCRSTDDATTVFQHIEDMELRPGLIVVDTLAAAFGSGNENSPDDMNGFLANIRRLCAETNAHILTVHHTGKDAARGARGHSALRASVDTEIEVVADDEGNRTATVTKQRDGESGTEFHFRLESIEVGQDEDGDSITSCVVTPTDSGPGRNRSRRSSISPQQKRAIDVLHDCLTDQGQAAPDTKDYPPGTRVAPLDAWRTELTRRGVLSDENKDTASRQWRRIREQLATKGMIAEYDGLVWAVAQNP